MSMPFLSEKEYNDITDDGSVVLESAQEEIEDLEFGPEPTPEAPEIRPATGGTRSGSRRTSKSTRYQGYIMW